MLRSRLWRRSSIGCGSVRVFLIGVAGSAANCSHAVNDFRKLCGIETYSPVDNVSELTARTNDEGWDTVFAAWLEISQLNDRRYVEGHKAHGLYREVGARCAD